LPIDVTTKRCQESSYLLYSSLLSDGLFSYHIQHLYYITTIFNCKYNF
jgi:hypothetical protein